MRRPLSAGAWPWYVREMGPDREIASDRGVRWPWLRVALLLAVSLGLAGGVPQAAVGATTPSRQVAKATTQIKKIPRSAFAPKRRGIVLGFAAAARRSLKRGATCKAIAAVDR